MRCKECGTKLDDGVKFCSKCGSAVVYDEINKGDGQTSSKKRQAINKKKVGIFGGTLALALILVFIIVRLVGGANSLNSIEAKTPQDAAEQIIDCVQKKETWMSLLKDLHDSKEEQISILNKLNEELGGDYNLEDLHPAATNIFVKYGDKIISSMLKIIKDAKCIVTDVRVDDDRAVVEIEITTRNYLAYMEKMLDNIDAENLFHIPVDMLYEDMLYTEDYDIKKMYIKEMRNLLDEGYKHPGKPITTKVCIDLVKKDGNWGVSNNPWEQHNIFSKIFIGTLGANW